MKTASHSNRFLGELSDEDKLQIASALSDLAGHASWPTFIELLEAARIGAQANGFEADDAEENFRYTKGYLDGLKFTAFLVKEFVSKGEEVVVKESVRRRVRSELRADGDTSF